MVPWRDLRLSTPRLLLAESNEEGKFCEDVEELPRTKEKTEGTRKDSNLLSRSVLLAEDDHLLCLGDLLAPFLLLHFCAR